MIQKGVIVMDPLGELEESLAYMFELQKTQRQGKYINPLVEELKGTIDNYKENSKNLSALTTAITKAYPIIENYVDSYTVKQKMEALLEAKGESISWSTSRRPGKYPSFQFESAPKDNETDFISWL